MLHRTFFDYVSFVSTCAFHPWNTFFSQPSRYSRPLCRCATAAVNTTFLQINYYYFLVRSLLLCLSVGLAYALPSGKNSLTVTDDRCPVNFSHHLLEHEYDCSKYYYCEWGERFIEPRDCAPGTHFSYAQQVRVIISIWHTYVYIIRSFTESRT